MAILHGLRTARFMLKGLLLRSKIVPDPHNPPRVLTCRMYVGLRMTDLFGHMNNAVYLNAFEFARWQVFQASGFNQKAVKAKIFPVVGSVHINYFRQVLPFQNVTIQTGTLGLTANGRQMICVQHMFDSKKRLCATGIFHVPLLDWKTNKALPIQEAFDRMGLESEQIFMLQRGHELNNKKNPVYISVDTLDKYKKACSEFGGMHMTDFFPKTNEHVPMHPAALEATLTASAYLTEAAGVQRKWVRGEKQQQGVAGASAEGKSSVKK